MAHMDYMQPDTGFLGHLPERPTPEMARAVVIPFPIEKTVSYGGGTKHGPAAIITASHQVELFDEELGYEPYQKFLPATVQMPTVVDDHAAAIAQIETLTEQVYAHGKFPVIIGGEHSLTLGTVRATQQYYPDVTILYFDAHSDMRLEYDGSIYSHAAVLRRVLELPKARAVHIGCRNISTEEYEFVQKNPEKIRMFWAKDMPWDIDALVDSLGEHVFISFDVDVFDASLMPSTGTPEPGGIDWWTTMKILKRVCEKKTLVGADFSECAPIQGLHAPDFTVAKLVYKTMNYKFANQ